MNCEIRDRPRFLSAQVGIAKNALVDISQVRPVMEVLAERSHGRKTWSVPDFGVRA
jgi:hypothetical protein